MSEDTIKILYSDHPDFRSEMSNLSNINVIILWDTKRLVSRYSYGHVLWTIRHMEDRIVYSINTDYIQLVSVKKEKFFSWIEENHSADMEWLIWNLDKIGF